VAPGADRAYKAPLRNPLRNSDEAFSEHPVTATAASVLVVDAGADERGVRVFHLGETFFTIDVPGTPRRAGC